MAKTKPSNKEILQYVKGTKRVVISIDSEGIHFREVEFVEHNLYTGRVRYDCYPVSSLKHPRKFRTELAKLIEKHS